MAKNDGRLNIGFNLKDAEHLQVKKVLDSLPKGAKASLIVRAIMNYLRNPPDPQIRAARDALGGSTDDSLVLTALLEHWSISGKKANPQEIQFLIHSMAQEGRPSPSYLRKPSEFTCEPYHTASQDNIDAASEKGDHADTNKGEESGEPNTDINDILAKGLEMFQ